MVDGQITAIAGPAQPGRLALTTPLSAGPALEREAADAAARHSLPFLPRRRLSLEALARGVQAQALVVLGARGVSLWMGGEERRWGPGMGVLRARRLLHPEHGQRTGDTFLEAAQLRPGETVLDCTLGLGADALVAAAAVGPTGQVVGLESSPTLALLAALGLPRLARGGLAAAGRVEVRPGDAAALLAALPDLSFDLVTFDPMFRHRRAEPAGFDLVRRLGDPRPLAPEVLARAGRVARRVVLVKDGTPGWDLARLGLTPLPSARGAHRLYARIPADGERGGS